MIHIVGEGMERTKMQLCNRVFPAAACAAVAALVSAAGSGARADVISDAAFFTPIPHTLVTFDVDGAGNTVNLAQGQSTAMPAAEYASLGITFNPAVNWVNDGDADFDAAQAIGGSVPIAIPSGSHPAFRIQFSTPVHAFGFWVVDNANVTTRPRFTALNGLSQTIEQVTFTGGLVDGTIGIARYGFMGISSPTAIAAIDITKQATIFDNFYFSAVPEPASAAALLALPALALSRRRPK